jgi:transcriptional regulator with XRE-family HTH domain
VKRLETSVHVRPMRRIRAERGLSIQALAEESGCSTRTIQDIELGYRSPIQRTAHKLAAGLGVPIGEVVEFRLAMHLWSSYRKLDSPVAGRETLNKRAV